jgi:hypothetical protein
MIRRLRALGWQGPFPAGKHPLMQKGDRTVHIPNPHRGDLDWSLTIRLLRQGGISVADWESVA